MIKLTASELQIMKCVWDLQEAGKDVVLPNVKELANANYSKDWKPQTVSTFLARLVQKNYLELKRDRKLYYYNILVSQEDYLCEFIKKEMEFWTKEKYVAAYEAANK